MDNTVPVGSDLFVYLYFGGVIFAICFTFIAPIYLLVGNSKWFRVVCWLWTIAATIIFFYFVGIGVFSDTGVVGGFDWEAVGMAIVGIIAWLFICAIILIKPIIILYALFRGHKYAKENEMYPHQEHEKRLREEERAEEEHQEYMRLLRAQRRYLEGNDRRLP